MNAIIQIIVINIYIIIVIISPIFIIIIVFFLEHFKDIHLFWIKPRALPLASRPSLIIVPSGSIAPLPWLHYIPHQWGYLPLVTVPRQTHMASLGTDGGREEGDGEMENGREREMESRRHQKHCKKNGGSWVADKVTAQELSLSFRSDSLPPKSFSS